MLGPRSVDQIKKYSARTLAHLALFAAAVLCPAPNDTASSATGRAFAIKPPPSWVEPLTASVSGTEFTNNSGAGAVTLLSDHQTRVTSSGVERYFRRVGKVLTSAGLDDVSQLELEFEPSYQQLIIHYIQIRRGDTSIDALKPSEIKVVQKEEELNQRLYNGTLSAVIFLNDVRAGDVIDIAYSINGQNPVLGGKYTDRYVLASSIPADRVRWRLLFPSSRELHYRGQNWDVEPAVRTLASEREYVWERKEVAKQEYERGAPAWFSQTPTVELTEFKDWQDVVCWALPLYQVKRPLSPVLTAQIERWRNQSQEPEKRLLAALRFVQDEVRYTGIELGSYSHTPTRPSVVCERRFGDCKDKSLLLVTALNELGIDASPALVDTDLRDKVSDEQPSPYAFNHVIVRATIDGNAYWLDPTITLQRGGLDQHPNPEYERGLVIRESTRDLESIPLPQSSRPTTELKEVYTASGYQGGGSLEVVTTYRETDADTMRYRLSQQSLAEIGKSYLGYYADIDPSIESQGPLEVRDDPEANTLVVTERYRIASFWKGSRREFYAGRIYEEIGKTVAATRKAPLALNFPSYITETIEAHLPEHFSIKSESGKVATDALDFHYAFNSAGKTLTLAYQLRLLKDHVPPEQISKHNEAVGRIQKVLGYEIGGGGSQSDTDDGLTAYLPLLLVFGPFVVFGAIRLINRRRNRVRRDAYRKSVQLAPGDAPELAISVGSPQEFGTRLLEVRCACGASYSLPDGGIQHESLIYDGRRVAVVSVKCNRCSRAKDVYFALR